jgi:hypothetical protein
LREDGRIAESQLLELRNMRVLLEEARVLARNLAYHRRARLEEAPGKSWIGSAYRGFVKLPKLITDVPARTPKGSERGARLRQARPVHSC